MKGPKFKPRKITNHGIEVWQINIPPKYSVTKKRERRTFHAKSDAEAFSKRLKESAQKFGEQTVVLPLERLVEASRCLKKLKPYGISLETAVDAYIERIKISQDSVTFSELVNEVIKKKKSEGRKQKYLRDLRSKAGKFFPEFGETLLCDISPRKIDDVISGLKMSPISKNSYKRNLKVIFSAAVEWGMLAENPVTKIASSPVKSRSIEIFSVEEVKALLEGATVELLPYYIFATFCGIRPSEIRRLTWEEVDFEAATVEVKAEKSKTLKRRFVDIEPIALEWLSPYRGSTGKVVPTGWRKKFDANRKESGFSQKWKHDVLRHTYASYHAAKYQDKQKTAYQLGHTNLNMLEAHYWRAVKPDQVDEFWNLQPKQRAAGGQQISETPSELPRKLVKAGANCRTRTDDRLITKQEKLPDTANDC